MLQRQTSYVRYFAYQGNTSKSKASKGTPAAVKTKPLPVKHPVVFAPEVAAHTSYVHDTVNDRHYYMVGVDEAMPPASSLPQLQEGQAPTEEQAKQINEFRQAYSDAAFKVQRRLLSVLRGVLPTSLVLSLAAPAFLEHFVEQSRHFLRRPPLNVLAVHGAVLHALHRQCNVLLGDSPEYAILSPPEEDAKIMQAAAEHFKRNPPQLPPNPSAEQMRDVLDSFVNENYPERRRRAHDNAVYRVRTMKSSPGAVTVFLGTSNGIRGLQAAWDEVPPLSEQEILAQFKNPKSQFPVFVRYTANPQVVIIKSP